MQLTETINASRNTYAATPVTNGIASRHWEMYGTLKEPLRRVLVPIGGPSVADDQIDLAAEFHRRHGSVITLGYVGAPPEDPKQFMVDFAGVIERISECLSRESHVRIETEIRFTADWIEGVIALAADTGADLVIASVPSALTAQRFRAAARAFGRPFLIGAPMEGGL